MHDTSKLHSTAGSLYWVVSADARVCGARRCHGGSQAGNDHQTEATLVPELSKQCATLMGSLMTHSTSLTTQAAQQAHGQQKPRRKRGSQMTKPTREMTSRMGRKRT
eukprot:EG_transcript_29185